MLTTQIWTNFQPLFVGGYDPQKKGLTRPSDDLITNPPRSCSFDTVIKIMQEAWKIGGLEGAQYMIDQINSVRCHENYKWMVLQVLISLRNPGEPSADGKRTCEFFIAPDGSEVFFAQQTMPDGRPELLFYRFDNLSGDEVHIIGRAQNCTIEQMAYLYWSAIHHNPEFYGSELVEIAGPPPELELTDFGESRSVQT